MFMAADTCLLSSLAPYQMLAGCIAKKFQHKNHTVAKTCSAYLCNQQGSVLLEDACVFCFVFAPARIILDHTGNVKNTGKGNLAKGTALRLQPNLMSSPSPQEVAAIFSTVFPMLHNSRILGGGTLSRAASLLCDDHETSFMLGH